jgi:RecB family exonuclease
VTRLVRAADLEAFRGALVSLACDGDPLSARHRLVVVPTRAAAAHLLRTIERSRLSRGGAVVLPDFVTPGDLPQRFADRLSEPAMAGSPARREVLLGLACRDAIAAGAPPPFRLRPGLVAEILHFYDVLLRHRKDVDTFERLALGALQPGAEYDRGAERLVRQTRFLVCAFRAFEARCRQAGCLDEHELRRRALARPAPDPWRHLVVAVADHARDPHGLWEVDWDLLARVPGVERLDVVVTDTVLAGPFHERIHDLLPGLDEVRWDADAVRTPVLRVPPEEDRDQKRALTWTARDREEEVASFARWARNEAQAGRLAALDEMAIVVRQPLPYVYLAREVLRSGGVPSQTFDALPLAGEPFAAAFDIVCSLVSTNFARIPSVALLRSPHLQCLDAGAPVTPQSVAALDRALSEVGYLGELEVLERLIEAWTLAGPERGATYRALPAARALLEVGMELSPLRSAVPVGEQLSRLRAFLNTHANLPGPDDPLRKRQLRARGAVLGILASLQAAYEELDAAPAEFDEVAALVRRWIEAHTFAPRAGDGGVHVLDAESARFGEFSHVQLSGLVDGEWPERPRRNVFYSPAILRDLGWPPELERLEGARAAFVDLLHLPSSSLTVSTFALEDDAIVPVSTLVDEVERAGFVLAPDDGPLRRVFEHELLGLEPVHVAHLPPEVQAAALRRLRAAGADPARYRGQTAPPAPRAYSLSAIERYQDCPFKFFAADILRLEEPPEDEWSISPRARGRFIHELFQRFFEEWDAENAAARASGPMTPDRLDAARSRFTAVADEMLTQLPEADAALERTRLFGSAISTGIVDIILGLEAARPADVEARWLEYRLEGEFTLGGADGRRVAIKGVADRIDLLSGRRLRVIDYKSGAAPRPKRALQVPIYALCAQERLAERDGREWTVDEAAYVALTGPRPFTPVVRSGASDGAAILASARGRLIEVLDGVEAGIFPARPYEPRICTYCAYASVCRKDYVGDE